MDGVMVDGLRSWECHRSPAGHHEIVRYGALGFDHCRYCGVVPRFDVEPEPMTVRVLPQELGGYERPYEVPVEPIPPSSPDLRREAHNPQRKLDRKQRLRLLDELAQRDGLICFYCDVELDEVDCDPELPLAPTIDHVLPRSKGGGWEADNIVLACKTCNQTKRDQLVFVVHLLRRLRREHNEMTVSLEKAGKKIEHLTRERDEARGET